MQQAVDGACPVLRKKTTDEPRETQTSSKNQSSAMCLPVVVGIKKLVRVGSDKINLHPKALTELKKAFNKCPYLTLRQTKALAQGCSLHPDQVKMWFMVQRLHCGISWDYKDILNVSKEFESNQEVKEQQSVQKGNGKKKIKPKEGCGRKTGEAREGHCETEGDIAEASGQPKRKLKHKPPAKTEELQEGGSNTQKKPKWMVKDQKKEVNITANSFSFFHSTQGSVQKTDDACKMEEYQAAESSNRKDLRQDESSGATQTDSSAKTPRQLMMMRAAFLQCQYPTSDNFKQLEMRTGIPCSKLMKWFSDKRYHIKFVKPQWMTQRQHSQILSEITQHQCRIKQAKAQAAQGKEHKRGRSE